MTKEPPYITDYAYAIVGGGFPGLFASYYTSQHSKKTILFETSKNLGGVMQPIEFEGLKMDLGTHSLTYLSPEITKIFLELSNHTLKPNDYPTNSRLCGKIYSGAHYPDLTGLSSNTLERTHKQIFKNTKIISITRNQTYYQYMKSRWGEITADALTPTIKKMTNHHPKEIDRTSMYFRYFDKIKISEKVEPRAPLLIKFMTSLLYGLNRIFKIPFFNIFLIILKELNKHNRIEYLSPKTADINKKIGSDLYPEKNYIGAFTEEIIQTLNRQNVTIKTKTTIKSIEAIDGKLLVTNENENNYLVDYLFWGSPLSILETTLFNTTKLKNLETSSGMLLVYFILDKQHFSGQRSYFEQLDNDMLLWRIGFNKSYVNGDPNHIRYYACIEIPMKPEIYHEANIDDIKAQLWQEAITLNLVKNDMPQKHMHLYTPHVFKILLKGHQKQTNKLRKKIKKHYPNIIFLAPHVFNRSNIADMIINKLNPTLK